MKKKQCTGPGCYAVIDLDKRFCDLCKRQDNKRRNQRERDPESKKLYDSKAWEIARETQLADHPFCQCKDPYCKVATDHPNKKEGEPCGRVAGEVDHDIPIRLGGSKLDTSNLNSLCHDCHVRKTRKEDGWNGGNEKKKVIVVCGAPGSGKSTWVKNNSRKGDLILDFDKLMSAICNFPLHRKPEHLLKYGWEARDAILNHLDKSEEYIRAFIIITGESRRKRDEFRARYGAKVVVLETPELVCLQRVENDLNRDHSFDWSSLVSYWWSHYEPSEEDIKINE